MQQPSAQGIASLFRGNPAPLQQRIQMEQQGKPGLPPDLQKLLALNIVTNEKDAVAKQQAMDQLNQMQGQQGKPPTVMQTVQEQARQKMQAQQVQAQQQQQAMQAMMQQAGPGPVPPGTPQPQSQPQGIDELPVEFSMAEGGIIAFEKGGSIPSPTPESKKDEDFAKALQEVIRKNNGELPTDLKVALAALDVVSLPGRGVMGAINTGIVRPIRAMGADLPYIPESMFMGDSSSMTPAYDQLRRAENSYRANQERERNMQVVRSQGENLRPTMENDPRLIGKTPPDETVSSAPKPIQDLKSLAEQESRKKTPRPAPAAAAPAPMPAAAPVATEAAPVQESDAEKLRKARMALDPAAERIAEQERRRREIGELDTSTHDRMIAELEKRKAQLEGPQDSFGKLMEYLGQVAATPRGMSSFEAGAAGAANLSKAQKARQLEQFDLSKQALDVSQKKIDAVRAFATEQYNVGKTRFDQVYKEQFDAAKEITKDESEARRLAQENTLKRLEIDQKTIEARERNKTQLQGYAMQQLGERNEQARIDKITSLKQQARRATDPKIAAELMAQATDLEALVGRGGGAGSAVAADRQELAELKALLKNAEDTAGNLMLPKPTRDAAVKRMEEINRQIAGMTKMGSGATTPPTAGKVPPPPPGFKVN